MDYTSTEIARITGGSLTGSGGLVVSDLLIDSRQVSYTENTAFIAIRGANHDGHDFVEELYDRGVRVFLVERLPENTGFYPDAAFIVCGNTVDALQLLAASKRSQFSSAVIAVTGSAGKTIVKEWLGDLLGRIAPVIRSPRSYNSQIGVPLSVWKLNEKFRFGIFEAGISFPGEMEKLQKVIRPDIGVITNIGDAHSENFAGYEAKAAEKLKLFAGASTIVFCRDHPIVRRMIMADSNLNTKNLVDWSLEENEARVTFRQKEKKDGNTVFEMTNEGRSEEFVIPFTDRASVENAITAVCVCLVTGMEPAEIKAGLAGLMSVAMRMEMKSGINNCHLIEDYYNSDPGSLKMALDFLRSQNNARTTLILSDFVQSGREEKELYAEVAQLVGKTGIDKFIGIGDALMRNSSSFEDDARFFYSTANFIENFNAKEFRNEVILLKGARKYEFEKIARLLEQQVHITVLEISLDAISSNINEFRRILNPGTRIMAMVKAFGYGSGGPEIALLLEFHRVSCLGVACADEGVELRKSGVRLPVIVMNPDISSAEIMIENNLEPEIYNFSSLSRFADTAARNGLLDYPVHIKIDTGMHRLGFMPGELGELAARIKGLTSLKIMSVFSHLAASENPAYDQFTINQIDRFNSAAAIIREATGYPFLKHILNTAGIIRFPQYQFDMVRPGLGIYGSGSWDGINLRPVSRFKTRILQVKKVPAGEPVGYGCGDRSGTERMIAILPVGYADGLRRVLGNGMGSLFIKGRRVPIVGNICMDMCMADVTGTDASEGDDAEIFGPNIPISDLAAQCGTIPYEILTSIPARVKRVFYRE